MHGEITALVEDMVANGGGLTFSSLDLALQLDRNAVLNHTEEAQVVGAMIERVLCANGGNWAVLETVSLYCDRECGTHIARFCSAIAETQSTLTLELALEYVESLPVKRTWAWQWLAYALFSPYVRARSSVTSIKLLDVYMTGDDAEATAAVLSSCRRE